MLQYFFTMHVLLTFNINLSVLSRAMQLPVCVRHLTATAEKTLLSPILSQCYAMPGHICQWRDPCRDVSPCVRPVWPEGPPLIWIMFLIVPCRWLSWWKQCRHKYMHVYTIEVVLHTRTRCNLCAIGFVGWLMIKYWVNAHMQEMRKKKSHILHHPKCLSEKENWRVSAGSEYIMNLNLYAEQCLWLKA